MWSSVAVSVAPPPVLACQSGMLRPVCAAVTGSTPHSVGIGGTCHLTSVPVSVVTGGTTLLAGGNMSGQNNLAHVNQILQGTLYGRDVIITVQYISENSIHVND